MTTDYSAVWYLCVKDKQGSDLTCRQARRAAAAGRDTVSSLCLDFFQILERIVPSSIYPEINEFFPHARELPL